jgi:uncharacterized protein
MDGKEDLEAKHNRLEEILRRMGSALVAYSGGVDSALVLKVAHDVLRERAVAGTSISPTFPASQLEEAKRFAASLGIRHLFVDSDELRIPGYSRNDPDRCYLCKNDLYARLAKLAEEEGLDRLADGTNRDDLSDYRPGLKAARERGVRSPLVEAGLGKDDVRAISKLLRLPTWDKPASACLSSRFPHGTQITRERLSQVEEAEEALRGLGFRQFRVRYHQEIARIELNPEEIPLILKPEVRQNLTEKIRACGFRYVTLDLEGYRRGSLHKDITDVETASSLTLFPDPLSVPRSR